MNASWRIHAPHFPMYIYPHLKYYRRIQVHVYFMLDYLAMKHHILPIVLKTEMLHKLGTHVLAAFANAEILFHST